jgi:glycosyltransferase involved in cell wall biosynthesis
MDGSPLVSVVTPVHNGEAFLAECLESVLAQTFGHFEYVVLDNGSTDGSLEVLLDYAERDRRLRIERLTEHVGEMESHNVAFRLISPSSKYCKVVSPEDILFPQCVARMVALAEAHPSVGFVGSYQLVGDRVRWQGFDYPRCVIPGAEICRRVLLGRDPTFGFGTPTSMLYRADLLRSSQAFYPRASPHSDASAYFKNLTQCDFGFVFRVLSLGRVHDRLESAKSTEINRFAYAYIKDLQDYGPLYLTPAELEERLEEQIDEYYQYLAVNRFMGRGPEFWDYHRGSLRDLGYPLTTSRLLQAAGALALRESLNPGTAVAKSWRRLVQRAGRPRQGSTTGAGGSA